MNIFRTTLTVLTLALGLSGITHAQPFKVGDTVPENLTVTDHLGKTRTFGSFRGHPTVLEWTNYGCPFTRKHYDGGNMQNLQATYTAKGVNWYSVISSAPGKQGYIEAKDAPGAISKMGFKGTAVILDPTGTLGRAFKAENTPAMYILDADGKLVYSGAIDSIPSFSKEDIAKAENYVAKALDEIFAGQPVSTPVTRAYGCSVKY